MLEGKSSCPSNLRATRLPRRAGADDHGPTVSSSRCSSVPPRSRRSRASARRSGAARHAATACTSTTCRCGRRATPQAAVEDQTSASMQLVPSSRDRLRSSRSAICVPAAAGSRRKACRRWRAPGLRAWRARRRGCRSSPPAPRGSRSAMRQASPLLHSGQLTVPSRRWYATSVPASTASPQWSHSVASASRSRA
jgi:hypothetical protein